MFYVENMFTNKKKKQKIIWITHEYMVSILFQSALVQAIALRRTVKIKVLKNVLLCSFGKSYPYFH